MMKQSFILHKDSLCVLEDLTNEQRGELFYAIYCYQIGKELELSSIIKIAFSQFKNQFIRDEEKFIKTVEARKQAGSKGGKQRVANQANASTTKQTKANQAVSDSDSVNESDSVSVKDTIALKIAEKLQSSSNIINRNAFDEWMEYKKYKSIAPITKTINFLNKFEFHIQQQIVDASIMNNYKGLFEPKQQHRQQTSFKQQDKEQSDREFEAISQRNIFDVIDEMETYPNETVQGVICE